MHNEIELTLVLDEETWEVIFLFFDLKLETRYIATIGENQVWREPSLLRYMSR